MTITTYTSFAHAVADLTVTGVKRKQRYIPDQLSTADAPFQFTRIPTGQEGPLTAEGEGGWPQHAIELVIAVCPVGQSRQPTNYDLVLTLMDALSTTLRAVSATNNIAKAKLSWNIGGRIGYIGVDEWWLLVASIVGLG